MKPTTLRTTPPYDATRDITERDQARQRYYQLMAEQAAWNLKKASKGKSIWA